MVDVWVFLSISTLVLALVASLRSSSYANLSILIAIVVTLGPLLAGWFYVPIIPLILILLIIVAHKSFNTSSRRWVSILAMAMSVVFLVVSGALVYALPVFRIPSPTGAYGVGTKTLLIANRLPAQVWYPTRDTTNQAPYIIEGTPVSDEVSRVFGMPRITLAHFRTITTPAQINAPIAQDEQSYPVLLFSHGLGGFKVQNTVQVIELASHGYVIISIDHPEYAAAAVVGDSVITNQHGDLVGTSYDRLDQHIGIWVDNLRQVVDALPAINESLNNRLDVGRIGAFGHSFGGSAAQQLLLVDERVSAAMNMDGGTFGIIQPSDKPFLYMNSRATLDFDAFARQLDTASDEEVVRFTGSTKEDLRQNFRELLRRRESALQKNAYSLVIPDIQHIGFSDAVLYSPLLADDINRHPAINDFSRAFFDQSLKAARTTTMRDLARAYPDIAFQEHTVR